jgi:hypothetical protein
LSSSALFDISEFEDDIKVYTPTLTAQDGRSLTMPKPCGWSSHSFGVVFQGFIPGSDPFRNKQSISILDMK